MTTLLAWLPARASGEDRSSAPPPPPERARQIQGAVDAIVARTPLAASRVGIVVASLETGEVLYAREPDLLLNPASNVKLFTSAAALARLGPEYRFETEVLVDAPPARGVVKTLYVRGKGDPTLVTERLWALAGDIAHRGVKSVKGDLVLDDTFFDEQREGPGYDQESGDRSYLAPAGALSLNFNVIAIHVAPGSKPGERGRVEVEPASEYVEVENRTRTVKATARRRVTPTSAPTSNGRQRITVDARLPVASREQVLYRRIDDPPAYLGWTLKRLLELRGVKIQGKVRRAQVPPSARPLLVADSDSLAEIVRKLDKTSNNFVAEQLLKTLGAERKGAPGTWPKGVAAVEDFLQEVGIPRGAFVMKNGSGLNDTNRFSARQTVTLLRAMWRRFPLMADFLAALPVAGKDGTVRLRMSGTEGRLRAKTGTLEGVTSLSGYVETAGGDRLAFSVLVNDYPGRALPTVRAVDAVGSALAAWGGPPADLKVAVASATAPPPAVAADDAVRAHLATYYRLGRAADRRNVPFLRAALQTEADPVLRMGAAEALYLSDPDSEAGRRAFLDAVATDAASFGRLRNLGSGVESPAPVLGSLADLAAQGEPDALGRLVDLTPFALHEPGLAEALAQLWEDVARTAPDETARALLDEPEPSRDAAVGVIARGIARSVEPDHPLPVALREAAGAPDDATATRARALAARLDEQLAAARAVLRAGPAATMGPVTAPGTGSGRARQDG